MKPKPKEKWHAFSRPLEYTRLKVVFGFLFSMALVLTIGYVVYGSFQRILHSLDELSTPRQESVIVNRLIVGISAIQNHSGTYSVTMKAEDLNGYLLKRNEVHDLIDSLRHSIGKEDYYEKVDSLDIIFNQYIGSLNEWLVLKSANPKDVMKQVYETIEEGDSSLKGAVKNIPKSEIVTITTTVEKPVESTNKDKDIKDEKSKSFFKRFFGSKEEKEIQIKNEKPKESIRREVTTETRVKIDTSYYNQVDTVMGKMKESLNQAEGVKNKYNENLKQRAIQLLGNNLILVKKVNALLKSIDEKERAIAMQNIQESKVTAQEAYHKLVLLSIIGVSFSLLFVVLIFTDISKSLYYKLMLQKTSQEAQKLAKVKEEFLATMSHEIRTPLNSIIGFVDQLTAVDLKVNKLPPLKVLESSSQHLLHLVNDILDYSKIESGALHLEKIGFGIDDVVKDVFYVLQPSAEMKGIVLHYTCGEGLSQVLLGDPVRLKQILINLIGNGIKFTHHGHVELDVQLQQRDEESIVSFRISDTGIGIEQHQIDHVFTAFSQADGAVNRKYGGTGLGLSICKKLIDLHHGSIRVESERGKGTNFYVDITYPHGTINEYHVNRVLSYGHHLELQGKKVVIIDDDEMSTMLLKPVFDQWEVEVVFLSDSVKAWKDLQHHTYDLIILDLQMPVMDGYELMNRIKYNLYSRNIHTPLLVCTANVLLDENKLARLDLANGILYKPFRYGELWNAMMRALGKDVASTSSSEMSVLEKDKAYALDNFMMFAAHDCDQLISFISTFISYTKIDLMRITEAFHQKDYQQIGELAHKLKNTCGQLEATAVLSVLKKLESLIEECVLSEVEIAVLMDSLEDKMNLLFEGLEDELEILRQASSKI